MLRNGHCGLFRDCKLKAPPGKAKRHGVTDCAVPTAQSTGPLRRRRRLFSRPACGTLARASCALHNLSTVAMNPDPARAQPHDRIYLASQSPRRRQLLAQLGVANDLLLAQADEDAEALEALIDGELPAVYVERVTQAKLDAALQRLARSGLPARPVLTSDTTVALGRQILGKPVDADDATRILRSLSGRSHRVLTAVAVASAGRRWSALNVSQVRFAVIPDAEIARYVASGEAFGKAGAYAIQSAIAAYIAHIAGSYSGIMGLPLCETAQLLRQAGVRF
jgi:septum formation protein